MRYTYWPPAPNPDPWQEFPNPARPTDAESLRRWVAAYTAAVWPEHGTDGYPPIQLEVWRLQGWRIAPSPTWGAVLHYHQDDLDGPRDLMAPDLAASEDLNAYIGGLAAYLAIVAATAGITARVDTAEPRHMAESPDDDRLFWVPIPLHDRGVRVWLESWEALPSPLDTPALWVWSLADRTEVTGHQTRRVKAAGENQLQPALATAQAIHDALELLVPQYTAPDPATTPPRKVNQWR